jgi:predicted RNA binding protein YcfA (HicA-like mRNA interferase family)
MPKKIRELKSMLRKAGFSTRSGKGSHTIWGHIKLTNTITISGSDGDDAQHYQEVAVNRILMRLREAQDE